MTKPQCQTKFQISKDKIRRLALGFYWKFEFGNWKF